MQQDSLTLDNNRKDQLDSNIKKMLESGASNDDVMSYAGDFKNKFGVKKKDITQPDFQFGSQPLPFGSKPSQTQVDTSVPSVLLTDEQKKQADKERIGKRFETTLLDVPTEFGKVGRVMQAAKQVKETLPQAPEFRKLGEIPRMPSTQMTEGQRLGESLTKGEDFKDVITDKLTNKKTGLQKQLENAENAFRIYQGDEIANAAQGYIRPEETLKIKEELGFGEKMSNQGKNFVNQLEKFPYNSALAIGQTLNALLGEDLGGSAYRSLNAGGDVNYHRMVAFNELDKLNAERKYSKGIIDSITDLDLPSTAAAVSGAVLSLIGTVITSAPTAGVGLYTDMVGGGLYDYNSTKANRLGISVNELYETGQNDFFAPAIIAGAGAQLEKIGLKGIKKGILSNLKGKSAQKVGLIFHNSNKEGVTEWAQVGLESYSNALAEGKNPLQAGEEAVKKMFSKQGAESYLMGAVASGAAIGGGRILKGLTSSKSKKVASEAIDKIEQQQQEVNNPEISEESRVFIWENIQNNVKKLVDVIDSDVEESDNLNDTQKKEIFNLNKNIEALDVVANDPAVSEETKVSAQAKIDEYNKRINEIESAPIAPQPKIETREDIIKEIRAAEAEMNRTGDAAEYQLKINDLNARLENLVPEPEVEGEAVAEEDASVADIEQRRQEELKNSDTVFSRRGKQEIEQYFNGNPKNLRTQGAQDRYGRVVFLGKGFNGIEGTSVRFNKEEWKEQRRIDAELDAGVITKKEANQKQQDLDNRVLKRGLQEQESVNTYSELNSAANINAKYDAELAALEQQPKPKTDAVQVETVSQALSKQEDIIKDVLELSDDDATVLSFIYNSNLTPDEKNILFRQWKRGVMSVGEIKRMTVIDLEKLKNQDIDRWAKAILKDNKGKKVVAEDIDFEDIPTKKQEDAVQKQTASKIPVLTEAKAGQEVEQGKPQTKPKVVTEEGGKEEVVIDKESIVKNSAKELERVKSANRESEDGATFNIDGTKYEGVGLVVPVTSLNTTINKINPQMLADFVEKNKNKIGDMDTVKFGIYKFPNSNQISIDLNIIASEKFKDQAIEFGRLAGQESLFDLETYENVKTGSDGKNPIDFTDTQFKEISKALKDGRIPDVFAKEEVDTKQQIEDFGVAKNQVESVNSVISQVFDGLKKAGLTTAKNVGEWIGISKGSKVKNALFQPTYYGESGIVKKPSFDEKSADESIKSGRVKIVSPIDSLSDLSFSVTRPDDLFVGDIFHNGKKIGSFDGGVFYPLNGGENGKMWASVSAGAASGFSNQANRSLLINNGINLPKGFEGETLSYKKGALKNEWVAVNKKGKEFSFILPDNPKQGVVVITKGDSLKHKTSLSGKIGFVNTLLSYAKGKDGYNGLIDAIKSVYSIGSLKDVDSLIKLFNNYLKEGRMADGKTMDEAKTSYDNFRSALISKANPIITKMMRDMGYDGVEYFDGTQLKKGIYKATGKGIDEMFKDLGQEDFLKGLKNDDAYAALKITSPTMFEKDISHPSYPYVIKTVDGSPVGLDIFNKTFRTTGENIGDMANKDRSISQAAPQVTTTLPKYKLNQKIDLSGPLSTDLSGVLDKYESVSRTQSLKQGANAQYRIESGKNIIEALKNFNGSQKAIVAITHEIMHPTVVAIIDGAKDGNEVGLRHTKTIVEEFNKANPKNKVTVEQLIDGNDIFKSGTTSNQYRAVQEFIAKSWEKYHKEGGKGFSAAFQEVLSQITEAFKSVYKSISGKKLTPELRKMFDEILGKDITKEPELNESNVENAIELLDDIENNRRKSERASSKRKAELNEKITEAETELYKITEEAQIVKAINDNFDKIKKDLKEQGLLNVKC